MGVAEIFRFNRFARVHGNVSDLSETIPLLPGERFRAVVLQAEPDFASVVVVDQASERESDVLLPAQAGAIEQNALDFDGEENACVVSVQTDLEFGGHFVSNAGGDQALLSSG